MENAIAFTTEIGRERLDVARRIRPRDDGWKTLSRLPHVPARGFGVVVLKITQKHTRRMKPQVPCCEGVRERATPLRGFCALADRSIGRSQRCCASPIGTAPDRTQHPQHTPSVSTPIISYSGHRYPLDDGFRRSDFCARAAHTSPYSRFQATR